MFLILCGVVIVVVWAYILWVREWLEARFPDSFYTKIIHHGEDWLWSNSRTILAARLYWVGGIFVALHDMLAASGFDVTPFTTEVANLLPEKYRPLALAGLLMVTGIAFEWLRRATVEPLASKQGG